MRFSEESGSRNGEIEEALTGFGDQSSEVPEKSKMIPKSYAKAIIQILFCLAHV